MHILQVVFLISISQCYAVYKESSSAKFDAANFDALHTSESDGSLTIGYEKRTTEIPDTLFTTDYESLSRRKRDHRSGKPSSNRARDSSTTRDKYDRRPLGPRAIPELKETVNEQRKKYPPQAGGDRYKELIAPEYQPKGVYIPMPTKAFVVPWPDAPRHAPAANKRHATNAGGAKEKLPDDNTIPGKKSPRRAEPDDYEIVKKLGSGTYGVVYLVKRKDKYYAMKVMNYYDPEHESNKDELFTYRHLKKMERTLGTCQYLIKLITFDGYPNVTPYNNLNTKLTELRFVMEYVEGQELFKLVNTYKRFDEETAALFIIQIIEGTQALHDRNIIHRDLKIDNIMVVKGTGRIKILDYGLSKVCYENELVKTKKCTSTSFYGFFIYTAPEMYYKKEYGFPLDFWYIGSALYQMVIGYAPMSAGTVEQQKLNLINHRYGKLYFPPQTSVSIPLRLSINGLLHDDPDQRFGTKGGAKEIFGRSFFDDYVHLIEKAKDPKETLKDELSKGLVQSQKKIINDEREYQRILDEARRKEEEARRLKAEEDARLAAERKAAERNHRKIYSNAAQAQGYQAGYYGQQTQNNYTGQQTTNNNYNPHEFYIEDPRTGAWIPRTDNPYYVYDYSTGQWLSRY